MACPCSKYCNGFNVKNSNVHRLCKMPNQTVPSHMGWDWTTSDTVINFIFSNLKNYLFKRNVFQAQKGWRPGAIPRKIKEIMSHFLEPCPCDTVPVTKRPQNKDSMLDASCGEPVQQPTLRVQRKNDDYLITMKPLKDINALKTDADPYLNCDPIRFKISSNTEEKELQRVKKILSERGFKKCTCGKNIAHCCCRDNKELDALRKCINCIGDKHNIKDLEKKLFYRTRSKLDIEFTPPAGLIKNNLKALPDVIGQETQYDENDYKYSFDAAKSLEKGGKGKGGGSGGGGSPGDAANKDLGKPKTPSKENKLKEKSDKSKKETTSSKDDNVKGDKKKGKSPSAESATKNKKGKGEKVGSKEKAAKKEDGKKSRFVKPTTV